MDFLKALVLLRSSVIDDNFDDLAPMKPSSWRGSLAAPRIGRAGQTTGSNFVLTTLDDLDPTNSVG